MSLCVLGRLVAQGGDCCWCALSRCACTMRPVRPVSTDVTILLSCCVVTPLQDDNHLRHSLVDHSASRLDAAAACTQRAVATALQQRLQDAAAAAAAQAAKVCHLSAS